MSTERDCTEGCEDDGHKHKWEISPHPYDKTLTHAVYDSDDAAFEAAAEAAYQAVDSAVAGRVQTITIKLNYETDMVVNAEET